jgi:putative oxidoreductase
MKIDLFKNTPASKPDEGMRIVRVATAIIIGVHAVRGLLHPGDVNDFGGLFSQLGLPFGALWAWVVVIGQFLSCLALLFNRVVVPACFFLAVILISGICIIHAKYGWYVVGEGRNGVEFSVILIACLFAISWASWPRKQR